jgi:hypothetical protein
MLKKLFTVGKETTLCYSEQNNFAVHSETTIRANMSTVQQLSLPKHYWHFLTGGGLGRLPKLHKGMQLSVVPVMGFRVVDPIVTLGSRIVLEKLIVIHLFKKCSAFYRT